MAFRAELKAQTGELVEAVIHRTNKSEPKKFSRLLDASFKSITQHKFLRTNQFDVKDHLYGYEERFRIQDREALADALRERLDAVYDKETKWTPDILHFILELTDRPTQNSRLADLDLLREANEDPGVKLKWRDIAREDGWHDERDVWRRPNFADSSGDEEPSGIESESEESEDTGLSSLDALPRARAEDHIVTTQDDDLLRKVQLSQFWRRQEAPKDASGQEITIPITEFQATREVLFFLSGLKTTLFNSNGAPSPKYKITNIAWDTQVALLGNFAQSSSSLRLLRNVAAKSQQIALLQIFQDCIQRSLRDFDKHLSDMQQRLIVIEKDTVISLILILEQVRPELNKLSALSDILQRLRGEPYSHPFRYLELLFDATNTAQLSGNDAVYRFLGQIFYDCFKVYLRPIRLWMEEGKLLPNDRTFFVSDSAMQVPLNQVWQNQFHLRRTSDGTLHAPLFLQPAATKIFTAGKSVVVLKNLGKFEAARAEWSFLEPALDFDSSICSLEMEFAPFAELFNSKFESWIQSKHYAAATTLQNILFDSCGLWDALDALERVFFMSDGSLSVAFCSAVFHNLDVMNPNWHDHFTLTEIAQEAFESGLDPDRLFAHVAPAGQKCDLDSARNSVRHSLPHIKLTYRLTWPVQLVLLGSATGDIDSHSSSGSASTSSSSRHYQSIFTLLLQVRRAIHVINDHRMLSDMVSEAHNREEHRSYYALRSRLLWFCELFHTYLTALVLKPGVERMKRDLRRAEDVNKMVEVHSRFLREMVDEACLGNKLQPIMVCVLDVLDLCIKLSDARRANAAREQEELQEMSRLSAAIASPMRWAGGRGPAKRTGKAGERERELTRGPFVRRQDLEDEKTILFDGGMVGEDSTMDLEAPYTEVLGQLRGDFDRYVRFVSGGLRGVARASSERAAQRWDLLAEMLETGLGSQKDRYL